MSFLTVTPQKSSLVGMIVKLNFGRTLCILL
jgi:hypothetical protein